MSDTVTVLTADMMTIGPYFKRRGQCGCLLHWRHVDYGNDCNPRSRCERDLIFALGYPAVTVRGDERRYTRNELAQVRNRATALMGYTAGNPEARWAKKHRAEFEEILKRWGLW